MMKKKLCDRRGAAIELAMLMIVVCFSLSILLLSTTMLLHNQKTKAERRMEQSVMLEQIGQAFLSAVSAGEVDEDWLPPEDNGLADETIHRHSWQEEIVVEATCKTTGLKKLTCDCGATVTLEIPVEHRWSYEVTAPTLCAGPDDPQNGKVVKKCSVCEEEVMTEFMSAHWKGESIPSINIKATCQMQGEVTYKCEACHEEVTDIRPISENHNWGEDNKCVDCGLARPIITYSLTAYRTADKTVRYEVAITEPVSKETEPQEPTETPTEVPTEAPTENLTDDKAILKITIVFDKVDGTYLITEWTKNDRS